MSRGANIGSFTDLRRAGWGVARQIGSHQIWRHLRRSAAAGQGAHRRARWLAAGARRAAPATPRLRRALTGTARGRKRRRGKPIRTVSAGYGGYDAERVREKVLVGQPASALFSRLTKTSCRRQSVHHRRAKTHSSLACLRSFGRGREGRATANRWRGRSFATRRSARSRSATRITPRRSVTGSSMTGG